VIQVGGDYRLAPATDSVDNFLFDASEVYNNLTKWRLSDWQGNVEYGHTWSNSYDAGIYWQGIATFECYVKFFQEELNTTTGLVEVDYSNFVESKRFYVHEGCPETSWLRGVVQSNGNLNSNNALQYFRSYLTNGRYGRWLTNYPITQDAINRTFSDVTIHENERYLLWTLVKSDGTETICKQKLVLNTFDGINLLETRDWIVLDQGLGFVIDHLFSVSVGFQDIKDCFTPTTNEGTNWENVTDYKIAWQLCSLDGTDCDDCNVSATIYRFKVKRGCVGKGYKRFAFKNMLGGYDLVSSFGSVVEKNKITTNDYTKTTGFFGWDNAMDYGRINYQSDQEEITEVVTHPMRVNMAQHFAEMFNSTDVYLRVDNDTSKKVDVPSIATQNEEQPHYFIPIRIIPGTFETTRTTNGFVKLKFSFQKSINQRNPRM